MRIGRDGRDRVFDNILIGRLWRALKCEGAYLRDHQSVAELIQGLRRHFAFYNDERRHQGLGHQTPTTAYRIGGAAAEQGATANPSHRPSAARVA